MARFVLLRHTLPEPSGDASHWDLMLEDRGALRTWRLAELPTAGATLAAEQLADHRLAYLDYEGEVSGGRGAVARWDRGELTIERDEPDCLIVALRGEKLVARLKLVRESAGKRWLLRSDDLT